jgi:drug/metabolite transporter (DMT)-like permease
MPLTPQERAGAVAAYATLAFVWGSTYNAIKVAVEAFNPFFYSGVRFVVSGLLLLGVAAMLRIPFPRRWGELAPMVATGFLFLVTGNGLLSVAEMQVKSGVASVISPLAPIFVALMVYAVPGEERLSLRGWFGILLGLAGTFLLLADRLDREAFMLGTGQVLLLLCCASWSLGAVVQRRAAVRVHPLLMAGFQMLAGGLMLMLVWPATGPAAHAPLESRHWLALAYLILVGGSAGFFSYAYLLTKVPVARASTYGYVNPVVAVLIGWVLLDEVLLSHQLLGMGVCLVGGAIVHVSKRRAP